MSSLDFFAETYADTRQQLLRATANVDALVFSWPIQDQVEGETEICTDAVSLGDPGADRAVLLVSGTHGPEGLTGSACQRAVLDDIAKDGLPEGIAVVLVHAINAWGVAAGLRCTEEGVDLNRNYVRFERDTAMLAQRNPGYDDVHEQLQRLAGELSVEEFVQRGPTVLTEQCGSDAINRLFQGQYRCANGVGFGGNAAATARQRLERIVVDVLRDKAEVAVVDLHTGLGPFGDGMKLSLAEFDSDEATRVRRWYGDDVMLVNAPDSGLPYRVFGDTANGVAAVLRDARITGLTLEYGTYEVDGLVRCILAEHLIRHKPEALSDDMRQNLLDRIKTFFYPSDSDWRERVIGQARTIFSQAVAGLTSS